MEFLAVASGGALGAVLRYWLTVHVQALTGPGFPFGTLAVNVIGSLVIGFVVVYMHNRFHGFDLFRLFLVIGVLGGFTTFSTFSLDTVYLIQSGFFSKALINVIASFGICLLSVLAGMEAARFFTKI